MSFKNVMSSLARGAVVVLVAAAEAQAEQTQRSSFLNAEDREASKWEDRRKEACANIDDGLTRDTGTTWLNGLTSKQQKAIQLRAEVSQHCRNRSEAMMSYTEKQISAFQRTTW